MKVRQNEPRGSTQKSLGRIKKLFFVLFAMSLLSCCAKLPDLEIVEKLRAERIKNLFPLGKKEPGQVIEILSSENLLSQRTMGRTPSWMIWFMNDFLGWNPLGRSLMQSQWCEKKAEQWQDFSKIEDYFKDCEETIKNDSILALFQGLQTMTIDLKQELHPLLQRVAIHLPNQVVLKGYLGLRDTRKARPLIVLRSGVFSSVEEMRPETYLLMQLFEQSHFNFLVLENMSGPDFIHNNSRTSFGGYDEGLQNIWLAKYLKAKDNPLYSLIDSLHFFGLSLGGHGVLFASFLNEVNDHPIDSFTGICPLVQFEPTFERLSHLDGASSIFVNSWIDRRLAELKIKMQDFQSNEISSSTLSRTFEFLKKEYAGSMIQTGNIQLPLGLKDSSDFVALNNFFELALQQDKQGAKDSQSPVLIFATEDDPLVPFRLNSGWIKKQKARGSFAPITVQKLKYGTHCSLPDAYQWRPFASLLQKYVLDRSLNFKLVKKEFVQKLDSNTLFDDSEIEHSRFYIEWDSANHVFAIRYQFFVTDHPVHLDFKVKPSDLDMDFSSEKLTFYEQRMGIRWLYHNLKVNFDNVDDQMQAHLSWLTAL